MSIDELVNKLEKLNEIAGSEDWGYNAYFLETFCSLETRYPTSHGQHMWRVWRFDYDKHGKNESIKLLEEIINKRIKHHENDKNKSKVIIYKRADKVVHWFTEEAYDKFTAYEKAMIDIEIDLLKKLRDESKSKETPKILRGSKEDNG